MLLLRVALFAFLFFLYLISTVPVGLLLYSIKSEVGLDIFRDGGFHTYMQCLQRSFPLSQTPRATRIDTTRRATGHVG